MRSRYLASIMVAAGTLLAAATAAQAYSPFDPDGRYDGGAAGRGPYGGSSPIARATVSYPGNYAPGTIVISTAERRLYFVLGNGQAIRYVVGVGRDGQQWAGVSRIDGKYVQPAWAPPEDIKRENPALPNVIPGGSPHNPMGVAALTLQGGEYAIHGTNAPGSVGHFVSHGCIRMYNADITDLFQRVAVGTTVVVTR
jgi:lipoprotein-anchoring transpeptidase ErfK/SrfK